MKPDRSPTDVMPASESLSPELLDLFDRLTELARNGEQERIDNLLAENPQHAARLRAVLPALGIMKQYKDASRGETRLDAPIPDLEPSASDSQLGDFRLIREIGRGGMGIVYEAEQLSLRRRVAVKVLPLAGMLDNRALARFQNEARAAATLCHQHIVPVYFVGSERGVHFYAMQLIEGTSLAEVIGELRTKPEPGSRKAEQSEDEPHVPLSTFRSNDTVAASLSTVRDKNPRDYYRRIAEIGIQIAAGLQHAHESGILHRDIKPGNVLLDGNGKAWLTDFGLARLEADASMTATGDQLGTLRYMSPEQVSGGQGTDVRSDVYSLGITLYELAALEPAFQQHDRERLAAAVASEEPRRPAAHNASIPRELETIILKAIEKTPSDRYESSVAFATDLQRFLDHQPIQARRPTLLVRTRKWVRRHPSFLLAATVALAISLIAALAAAGFANAERERADIALQEKSDALVETQKQRALADAARVRAEDERERAIESLRLARSIVDSLYMQLGTQWIADETAPTNFQQGILSAAVQFYEDLTQTRITEPGNLSDLSLIASGYHRIGIIQHYLQNYEEAVEARRSNLRIIEEALTYEPENPAIRSSLAGINFELGQSFIELSRYDEALAAFDTSATVAGQLVQEEFQPIQHRYWLARNKLARAAVMVYTGSLTEAGRLAKEVGQELDDVLRQADRSEVFWADLRNDTYRADYWQAKAAAYAGGLAEASQICQKTLGRVSRLRSSQESQDIRLRLLEIDLSELAAEIVALEGDLAAAGEQYGALLEIRKSSLRAGMAPERFFMEAGFKHTIDMDGLIEPGPFCSYVESQLRLADVLHRAKKPYGAECLLGECRSATIVLVATRPGALRFQVADANVFAMAAELLADRRPAEADLLYRKATQVWGETLEQFPHAKEYVSGVHGLQSDWEYLQDVGRKFAQLPVIEPGQEEIDANQTVWHQHSTARSWVGVDLWESAISSFEKSAALRTKDHAYDWFHLAIAYANLGQSAQAQEWFDKAVTAIEGYADPHPELLELRDQAAKTLANRAEGES